MKKQYVLVKFSDNWADEMDVDGFRVFVLEDWELIKTRMAKVFEKGRGSCSFGIGTNEEIEYSSYADWLSSFSVSSISESEALFLRKHFPQYDSFAGQGFVLYQDEDWDED